ncbi:hypothetical protein [Actinomadura sp. DC4]|uniref:hypothetical protein n=1 Tax=Actinomadura sp. DC4 TaxID=3055069 RepID=UPI0025AF75B1|nr:hypothetical protein [Actinomadura sp. DC4]MDN3356106.1 hypothetical protein [Actinomadura sp. DC4]
MRPAPIVLCAAMAAAFAAGCSSHEAAGVRPTASASAPPSPTALAGPDKSSAQLACFSWTTYYKAIKINNANAPKYAVTAQQPTARMSDPRWSRVASLPPAEAMTVLGGLCKEIHYHE